MILDNIANGQPVMEGYGDNTDCIADMSALVENFIYDTVSGFPADKREEFLASEECQALQEAGMLGKKTLVRMAKVDDLTRRIKLAVLQKAKEDQDPNYLQYKKAVAKKKAFMRKMTDKYAMRVKTDAVKGQRALLKISPSYFTRPIR